MESGLELYVYHGMSLEHKDIGNWAMNEILQYMGLVSCHCSLIKLKIIIRPEKSPCNLYTTIQKIYFKLKELVVVIS